MNNWLLCIRKIIYDNWQYFFKRMFTCLGLLSTIWTVLGLIWPILNCSCAWSCCLFISFCYGASSVYPEKDISITFIRRRNINIKVGDLFDSEKGSIVVIPVNSYLDTQLENDVIAANTVHGKFITYYQNKYPDKNIDNEINRAIDRDGIQPIGRTEGRRAVLNSKQDKFSLGTIIRLIEEDKQFYLVVASDFDENNHVIYQPENFTKMLLLMMKNINTYNSGHPVYLPIIGGGQSGLNLSKQKLLCHILHCFDLAEHYVTTGGTTIIIHKNDKKEVSLNKLAYEFSNWGT